MLVRVSNGQSNFQQSYRNLSLPSVTVGHSHEAVPLVGASVLGDVNQLQCLINCIDPLWRISRLRQVRVAIQQMRGVGLQEHPSSIYWRAMWRSKSLRL